VEGGARDARQDAEADPAETDLVGDDLVLEVHEEDDDETRGEGEGDGEEDRIGAETEEPEEEARREELHGEVARGDGTAAGAAAPAEEEPGEEGDIVVRPDRRPAARAVRRRGDDRLFAREPVDADVQETPDDCAEHEHEE